MVQRTLYTTFVTEDSKLGHGNTITITVSFPFIPLFGQNNPFFLCSQQDLDDSNTKETL